MISLMIVPMNHGQRGKFFTKFFLLKMESAKVLFYFFLSCFFVFFFLIFLSFFLTYSHYSGSKLFVPPDQVDHVIKHFHSQGSNKHSGWNRTFKMVRKDHMGVSEIAVREYVKSCAVCLKFETVRFSSYSYFLPLLKYIYGYLFIYFINLLFIFLGKNLD